MKRIGIVSQSPTLNTGFGVTTKMIAEGLADKGFYVTCFGIDQLGETFERVKFNYKIWTVGGADLYGAIELFLNTEKLDVIIINFDVVNLNRYCQIIRKLGYKNSLVAHLVLDGTPFLSGSLEFLRDFIQVIVPTKHTFNYLENQHNLNNISYVPHGVDHKIYYPIKNKNAIKEMLNIGDKFVIGCFGRNTERKQLPTVLEAFKILRERFLLKNTILYMHCSALDNLSSWNLAEIARFLRIYENVVFKSDDSSIKKQNQQLFENLTLNERIGICDLCINVPFSGGFELHNLEVQACGIPLITTNDHGNISEVVNDGAILIEAKHIGFWRTGARQYHVSSDDLSQNIFELINNKVVAKNLSLKGQINAGKFNWHSLQNFIAETIINT